MHNPSTLKYLGVFILPWVTTGNEFCQLYYLFFNLFVSFIIYLIIYIYKTQGSAMEFDAVISLTSKGYKNLNDRNLTDQDLDTLQDCIRCLTLSSTTFIFLLFFLSFSSSELLHNKY